MLAGMQCWVANRDLGADGCLARLSGQPRPTGVVAFNCRSDRRERDDTDAWLVHDNTERPHPGYRNQGRRPIETVMSFVSQEGQVTNLSGKPGAVHFGTVPV